MSLSLLLDPDDDEMKKKKAKSPPSAGTAELGQNGGEELDDSPFQPSRSSSRLSARRCKQAAAEAERRAVAEAASWDFAAPLLWRELRAASEASRKKAAAKGREAKLAKQQRILRHIAWTRFEQDLPPVFAILRGPTIRPYRMEELSISIGRATPHHRVRASSFSSSAPNRIESNSNSNSSHYSNFWPLGCGSGPGES